MSEDRKATAEAIDRLRLFVQSLHNLQLDPPSQYAADIRATLKADIIRVIVEYDLRHEQIRRGTKSNMVGVCKCGDLVTEHAAGPGGIPTYCKADGCTCMQYEFSVNKYIPDLPELPPMPTSRR